MSYSPAQLSDLRRSYEHDLLEDVLPFWIRHGVDREHGGLLTGLAEDGALIDTDKAIWLQGRAAWAFATVSHQVRMTRFGGDCYAYCLLAAGHIDLIIEASLKSVDIAPLIPIIERAGGVVTSWTGGPAIAGGQVIAAGDPIVHAAAVRILSNIRSDSAVV